MHGEDGGIKEKMRAWKRIWKALLCSLLFYSRKNMKYDGAIVEYSKLETFYMVNFDLEEQTEPEKSSEHAGKQRGSGLFSCPGGGGKFGFSGHLYGGSAVVSNEL